MEKFPLVFENIERFVPHKILKKILDLEYCNGDVQQLKVRVRRAYNRRKLGEHFQADLMRLSGQLLAAGPPPQKKDPQGTYLCSVLQNKSNCWTESCNYVKRHKVNRENISAIEDCNGRHCLFN
jgi:hypothetical protein